MLNRLESEKTTLLSELNKLRQEKKVWAIQRSELEMTQAELSAENTQLRSELNSKVLLLSHCLILTQSGCFFSMRLCFDFFQLAVKISENQRISSVKTKLELEKEEAVKKVKEEMKVCNMLKVLFLKDQDLHKTKMRNVK